MAAIHRGVMGELNKLRIMPRHLTVYHGSAFLITGLAGFVEGGTEGFYYRQTRFLSKFHVRIGDGEPRMVSANAVASYALISYHLAPSPAGAKAGPDAERNKNGGEIVKQGLELQINRVVGDGVRHEVILTNRAFAPTEAALHWQLDADFADYSEAAAGRREQEAPIERTWRPRSGGGDLALRYTHPQLDHGCEIRLSGDGAFADRGGAIVWTVELTPQQPSRLEIEVLPVFCGTPVAPSCVPGKDHPPIVATRVPALTLTADCNEYVRDAWNRAVADLASLALLDGEGLEKLTPAAGIPKFAALFGRDALVVGFQAGLLDPDALRGTLRRVAEWNATEYDDPYDAEPGRVIHQRQLSPLALLRKNPFLHYYGDYSAPAWFLIDSALDLAITGDADFYRSLQDKIRGTLDWMDRDGDRDHDGFYEYATRAGAWGEKNQGWKDSEEAILYPDGQMVEDPIALVEVQAAYFAAKQATALAFATIGEERRAVDLLDEAEVLKRRFNEVFWLPEENYFALALDPAKKPVATIGADPGQCLTWGIVDADRARAIADRLMSPELFGGWGIRTLSKRHPAYNPFAYHLGSVWPVANALVGFGFKRYGFTAHLHRLAKAQIDATRLFELERLPEVFGGHARDCEHPHPGIYPGTNAPQAWSASAVVALVLAMVGLVPMAPLGTLIVDPDLPEWLPELTLAGIQVGAARATLRFRREAGGDTACDILALEGELRIHRAAATEPGVDRITGTVRDLLGRR
ncbi:MAG TPA: glycogen debranching N-terminal domain-containing protein [Stellaceae bacterium]|nr:glycogen debranching N-terminal domain-containing protein [Stellaceae bacterium]